MGKKKKFETKRFLPKIHVKKGDTVRIMAGADKGTEGEVLEVFRDKYRAIVAQANLVLKHKKPTETSEGGIVEEPASIHISNLMVVANGTASKVGRKLNDAGKLVRYSKKTGEEIK